MSNARDRLMAWLRSEPELDVALATAFAVSARMMLARAHPDHDQEGAKLVKAVNTLVGLVEAASPDMVACASEPPPPPERLL